MNSIAAWISLLMYLSFSSSRIRRRFSRIRSSYRDFFLALLLLIYLLAVEFKPTGPDFLRMLLYLLIPTLLLQLRSDNSKPFDILQVLTILAIWIPVELDLFLLLLHQMVPRLNLPTLLSEATLLPEVGARLVPGVDLPVQTLIALLLALYLFLIRHPLDGLGFTFRLKIYDLRTALIGFGGFILLGLPIGLGIGFLRFNPQFPTLPDLVFGIIGGYLLTALVEEILFRGIIQNLLRIRLGGDLAPLMLSSIFFGLAHLNNATRGFPIPNWGYVLMATIAGWAYGWVWQRSGKVTASATTHMLVNLSWGILFT